MRQRVRKAVIPAGGLGSRMHPLTRDVPKEMLPVGRRPMIRWCIEEALQSGIQEIAIVLNRNKTIIRDYLAGRKKIEPYEDSDVFHEALGRCLLRFIEQPIPLGSGDAIYRSRSFVGDELFAVMMPDFVCFDTQPALRQMVEALGGTERCTIGFLRLGWQEARAFGNVGVLETEKISSLLYRIKSLSDKRQGGLKLGRGHRIFRAVGRQIFSPDFFDFFDAISWEGKEELDDVPVIQHLIKKKGVFGVYLQGRGFDVGNLQGYHAANEYLKRGTHS
jgi:UTP--glucose-1-phosphate uridylyltransferase